MAPCGMQASQAMPRRPHRQSAATARALIAALEDYDQTSLLYQEEDAHHHLGKAAGCGGVHERIESVD